MQTQEIIIQNLKCNGCASTVRNKMSAIPGISEVVVDLETNRVQFRVADSDSEAVLVQAKHALKAAGYPEIGDSNTLANKAMSFVSCAIGRMDTDK